MQPKNLPIDEIEDRHLDLVEVYRNKSLNGLFFELIGCIFILCVSGYALYYLISHDDRSISFIFCSLFCCILFIHGLFNFIFIPIRFIRIENCTNLSMCYCIVDKRWNTSNGHSVSLELINSDKVIDKVVINGRLYHKLLKGSLVIAVSYDRCTLDIIPLPNNNF